MKNWRVYIPVAYFEVFDVRAESAKEAIQKVRTGDDHDFDQNCTDANPKWSRRTWAVECDENRNETGGIPKPKKKVKPK